jgi:hypothetical protein
MFGIGEHKRVGAGDNPVSVAKISGLFLVGAALIGAIPTSISLLSVDTKDPPLTNTTTAPTATSLATGGPDTGLRFSPLTNGKLTVSGSAQKDIIGMYVMIGPKPLGGFDTGCGNVADGRWQAEISTDASWPKYPLVTVPAYGSCIGTTSARPLDFTFQGTTGSTTPPPPAGQILDCTKQNGPSCLTGPEFGPPTTYQPNQ